VKGGERVSIRKLRILLLLVVALIVCGIAVSSYFHAVEEQQMVTFKDESKGAQIKLKDVAYHPGDDVSLTVSVSTSGIDVAIVDVWYNTERESIDLYDGTTDWGIITHGSNGLVSDEATCALTIPIDMEKGQASFTILVKYIKAYDEGGGWFKDYDVRAEIPIILKVE
jgi:hypothetical protein